MIKELYNYITNTYYQDHWLAILYQTIFEIPYLRIDEELEYQIMNCGLYHFKYDTLFKDTYGTRMSIRREKIRKYIDVNEYQDILIFISDKDYEIAKEYLDEHEVKREENVKINCKHFPFTCEERSKDHRPYPEEDSSCTIKFKIIALTIQS